MTDEKDGKIKYDINCALCNKTFGHLMRDPGDEFGEFYHCKDCVIKHNKEHEDEEGYWED